MRVLYGFDQLSISLNEILLRTYHSLAADIHDDNTSTSDLYIYYRVFLYASLLILAETIHESYLLRSPLLPTGLPKDDLLPGHRVEMMEFFVKTSKQVPPHITQQM